MSSLESCKNDIELDTQIVTLWQRYIGICLYMRTIKYGAVMDQVHIQYHTWRKHRKIAK